VEDIDRQILQLLSQDGRMSFTDLGKATGLSTSAVHQRVRRLEQRGVIRGYTVVVDPESVGLPLTAFVSVTPLDPAAPDDVPERLRPLGEIEACHSVAGRENYILKVRVATPGELESLLARIRAVASVSTTTTVVLSTPFESRSLPTCSEQDRAAGQA
jgi:Lrp/AsnC family leucine-responsive transcriptional regulator